MSTAAAVHRRMREQYETFPVPLFRILEAEDPEGDLGASFNLDLGLPREAWLPERPRIWVAGASTRVAVQVALQNRDAEVVASDLSARSLEMQARVAEQLGLRRIEFRREDLARAAYRSRFDYVTSIGVVMLMESPRVGMAALASALAPGGVVELMVYGAIARADARRCQELLRAIVPRAAARERLGLARDLFTGLDARALGARHPLVKLGRDLASGNRQKLNEAIPIVSHPFENSYDVYGAVALVESAGLRVRQFKNPVLSDPRRYIRSQAVASRLATLSPVDHQQFAYLLGLARHEVFAEDGRRPRPFVPVHEQPIDDLVLRALPHRIEYRFDGDRLTGSRRRPRLRVHASGFVVEGGGWRPGVSAYASSRIVPPLTVRLMDLADGRRTAGDVLAHVAREQKLSTGERGRLRRLLADLLVPPSRLFAVKPGRG